VQLKIPQNQNNVQFIASGLIAVTADGYVPGCFSGQAVVRAI
jgi:hypothetical protein